MRTRRFWTLLLVLAVPGLAAVTSPIPDTQVEGTLADASIEGTVTDASGRPLAGANVSVAGTSLGASTDADGRFVVRGASAGTVEVRVTLVGYAPHVERGVVVRDGAATALTVRLTEADVETVVADRGDRSRRGEDATFGTAPPSPAAPMSPPAAASRSASPGLSGAAMGRTGSASSEAGRSSADAETREEAADATTRRGYDDEYDENAQAGLLTAGDVDDHLNWDAFLHYSGRAMQQGSVLNDLRLDDRLTLRVVDASGRPVAGARVRVEGVGGGRTRGLTTEAGTDGRLALFPRYDFGAGVTRLEISVTAPGGLGAARTETVDVRRLRGDAERTVRLRGRAERSHALDLAVVLDVTGSMGDEHAYLTAEFEEIVARARRRYPDADLRFALVAYRDRGDDFVVRRWDFTRSEREMRERLSQLEAGGGGDWPEAVDEALEGMLDLDWRTGTAARIAFLVADAPPHANRLTQTMEAVREARARGLRIYPLAASGVDDSAEHVMRTAAVLTQGRYLFLTDDSGVGNAHAEPHVPCYEVSYVDALISSVIESELAGRRVEADPDDVVRTVGNPQAGVCEPDVVTQQGRPRRSNGGLGYD